MSSRFFCMHLIADAGKRFLSAKYLKDIEDTR